MPTALSDQKLLIGEAKPAAAWYFSNMVLRTALIDGETIFSSLSQNQRGDLTERFNDASSDIRALVLPYDVSCHGLNLQGACNFSSRV